MTPVLHSALLFVLAALVFLALGSVIATALVRALKTRITATHPRVRHTLLVALAALPWLLATALVFCAALPSVLALFVPGLDHCSHHDDGHAHLCFTHLPKGTVNIVVLIAVVFVIGYAVARLLFALAGFIRSRRIITALARTARKTSSDSFLLETNQVICFAGGLLRPRVFLSRGLLDTLTEAERAIVLAHERAHVRRRDALVGSLVRALSVAHLLSVARWLVREVELAAEQACDEEAALLVNDRLAVASAILTVERAAQSGAFRDLGDMAVAFGERAVARRVEALLAEPNATTSLRRSALVFAAIAAMLLGASGELHHLTESVLFILTR